MRSKTKSRWICGALAAMTLLCARHQTWAARFANQFIEFELPPALAVHARRRRVGLPEHRPREKARRDHRARRQAEGRPGLLDQYLAYLKSAKSYTSVQGKPVKSEPKYAKTVSIGGQPWVDSLHLESEIPGFYTRYLATVKADIGVLVTYSINKAKYQNYLNDFEAMVEARSRCSASRESRSNAGPPSKNLFDQAQIPTGMSESTVFPGNIAGGAEEKPRPKQDNSLFLIIGAGAAVLLFVLWRRKRGRGGDDF